MLHNSDTITAPRSWQEVAKLETLAAAGNEDAEVYFENPVLWAFAWENDMLIAA